MKSTGKIDANGNELFEGDRVLKWWGIISYKGKGHSYYQTHIINIKPAHKMANGEMHDDGGGIIFCLGDTYNFWEGSEVQKIESDELEVPNDTNFFFDENENPIILKTHHLFNLTEEEWIEELGKQVNKIEANGK